MTSPPREEDGLTMTSLPREEDDLTMTSLPREEDDLTMASRYLEIAMDPSAQLQHAARADAGSQQERGRLLTADPSGAVRVDRPGASHRIASHRIGWHWDGIGIAVHGIAWHCTFALQNRSTGGCDEGLTRV